MIALASDRLVALVDPAHGGEVLDLVDAATGTHLLGRPPFGPAPARAGELDEETWTAAYRGGWQTVAPNAGNACRVDGVEHGFHGAASVAPWRVLAADGRSVRMAWEGHGLRCERALALADDGLSVDVRWEAIAGPAPLVAVEHVVVGAALLAPALELRLPGGRAYELSETHGPVAPPADAPGWPEIRLLAGGTERGDRLRIDRRRSRFAAVAGVGEGWAEARNTATGTGLRLEWDAAALPHLWVWHEARASGWLWREAAELLAIEPATVPHSLGLARAVADGQATFVERGRPFAYTVAARPLPTGA